MREELRAFIVATFLYGEGTVADDEPLFEGGIIDSLGFMKLLAFIERRLGVPLTMSEVTLENFGSLDAMVETIARKQRERGAAPGAGPS